MTDGTTSADASDEQMRRPEDELAQQLVERVRE
jgi:hypothetical protein